MNGIPSGYPHQFYSDSEKTAESAFQSAEAIFNAIRRYLIAGGEEIVRIEANSLSEPK
jgi:hypothetical protein